MEGACSLDGVFDGSLVGVGDHGFCCCRWRVGGDSRNEDVYSFREDGCNVVSCDERWF